MKRSTDSMARSGVHAVAQIFTKTMRWIFREQHESDFGIDAQVEIVDGDRATGKLIALQIKSGPSHLWPKGDVYIYRGELRHLDYWLKHALPVFLIFHNPDKDLTLWRRVEDDACTRTANGWSIEIPATNILDERAKSSFEQVRELSEEEKRRERLTDEEGLIEAINKAAQAQFRLTVDTDEESGLTDLDIRCKDANGKETYYSSTSYGGGGFTAHEAMQQEYWFLNYDYCENVHRGDDYEEHTFNVSVKPEIAGYLAVQKILRQGPPGTVEPFEIPYDDPPFEEEFADALRRDWEEEAYYREDD